MINMTPSIVAGNKYRFHCPTTGREDHYLRCALRKHKKWRGEQIEGDCATCMNAGKCAAVEMIKEEWRESKALFMDSKGEMVHSLPKRILDRIEPVMIGSYNGWNTDVDPEQLARMVAGHFDPKGGYTAPDRTKKAPRYVKGKAAPEEGDLSTVAEGVQADMADAINQAIAA